MVEFEIVTKNLIKKELLRLKEFDFEKQLALVGFATIKVINERVGKSKSVEGGRFKKYTKEYTDFKKSKGRKTIPDLTFSGEMLNALQTEVKNDSRGSRVVVDFEDRRHRNSTSSIPDIARANDKIRPFFSLSDSESDEIIEDLLFEPYRRVLGK